MKNRDEDLDIIPVIEVALTNGRHIMPDSVEGSIFSGKLDPTDIDDLRKKAHSFLEQLAKEKHKLKLREVHVTFPGQVKYELTKVFRYVANLVIYVDGPAVLLVAATIQACNLFYGVELRHYDYESGSWYSQPFC